MIISPEHRVLLMSKKYEILFLTFIASILLSTAAFGAVAADIVLVREGSGIVGMEGEVSLIKADANNAGDYMHFEGDDIGLFRLGSDVNDYQNVLGAGAQLQLLPSTALEKMTADFEDHPESTYRLWGRITKYKGANYIFPGFVLPIVEMAPIEIKVPIEAAEANEPAPVEVNPPPEPNEAEIANEPTDKVEPNEPADDQNAKAISPPLTKVVTPDLLNDPNGILDIPQDVLDKLNSKKIMLPRKMKPRVKQAPRKLEPRKVVLPKKIKDEAKSEEPKKESDSAQKTLDSTKNDTAPTKETTSIVEKKPDSFARPAMKLDTALADRTANLIKQDDGKFVFLLDALGLTAGKTSLQVLPCEVLELTELRVGEVLNPIRFKIAGIQTKYKGKDYILLQKATRVYGHGNF